MAGEDTLRRILQVIANEVFPVTQDAVLKGECLPGAAILKKADLSLVCVGTNAWSKSPLIHGETECLRHFWELPKEERPHPKDCLFITTHECCPLCMSAICWSQMNTFYYFFTHEDSTEQFDDALDAEIMREVWGTTSPPYRRSNKFFNAIGIIEAVNKVEDQATRKALMDGVTDIQDKYRKLSVEYREVQEKVTDRLW